MALIWDNPQRYSNQVIGAGGGNPDGLPGFWFGPQTVPDWTGAYHTTLNANAQLGSFQPASGLTINGGSRITAAGDRATIVMDLPDTGLPDAGLKAVITLTYVGQFTYRYVSPPTPARIGEFRLSTISFVDGNGRTVSASSTTLSTTMARAVATGRQYLYLQLYPHTGTESLATGNPAAPGSPVTLSNVDWDYDSAAPEMEIACFLPGTMIATSTGPKAVEDIMAGDLVLTGLPGAQKAEPVTWTGRGRVVVQPRLPDDRAGCPVCICKGALGDNRPDNDLWLTPEHTLFLNGHLVPVRMLVNHRSIFYDHDRTDYDCYHFETEKHSLVHACNVATESYLDTGNRYGFEEMSFLQQGNVVTLPTRKHWETDACAPLGTSVALVQPLHEALERRARRLGFPRRAPLPCLIMDSGFHLVTDQGELLHAMRRVQDHALFLLPAGVRSLQLRSRTSRPCDSIGPYVDDRRQLGLLVGPVELYQDGRIHHLTRHLTDPAAPGWDIVEDSPCRWTNGNATLVLDGLPPIRDRDMLAIRILGEGPYAGKAPAPVSTIALPRRATTS